MKFPILLSALLIGLAAWTPQFWFLVLFSLLPFFYVMESLPPLRSLSWTAIFVLIAAPILAFPLLSFRSIQALTITAAQHYMLDVLILLYVTLLALLAIAALWIPLAFTKRWYWRILTVSTAWVIFEFIKAKLSFDLQWISAGELLVNFLPLGIFARFGGVLLLSFFVFAINISLYESIKLFLENRRAGIKLFTDVATFWLLLSLAGLAYTKYITGRAGQEVQKILIAMVQPGSAQERGRTDFFTDTQRRTRLLATPDKLSSADLLIFPGNYFGPLRKSDFEEKNAVSLMLGFNPTASTSIIGFSLVEQTEKYQTNAVVSGDRIQYVFKEHLFPLADYTPAALTKFSGTAAKLSTGYSSRRNETVEFLHGIKGGVLACSEEFVSSLFSRLRKDGAQIIIVSGSNDDFASPAAYREVLRTGRLRALENGIWVAQAMKNGISAIIDPFGQIRYQLGKDERGVLRGEITVKKAY